MKQFARAIVVEVLGWQVRRLQKKRRFKTVAVVGSIGKTSTKFAIAQVLSAGLRVRFQQGNYNDLVTVPLVFFGHQTPSLFNPFAWVVVFIKNQIQLHKDYPFDVVVVELGTDGPGQIASFKRYLHVDVAVVTAITPEHMEFFADLDAVAREELSIVQYVDQLIINADLVAQEYVHVVPKASTYALHNPATYKVTEFSFHSDGVSLSMSNDGKAWLHAKHPSISEPHLYSLTAAAAVASELGLSADQITTGFANVTPVSGRMQRLHGIHNSTIIDDTYNASPEAAKAALETLYRITAPQKIALLGNMNELGEYSAGAHAEIGEYCDPKQLAEVITLGPDANEYLAKAAEQKGCTVTRCQTPYQAGERLQQIIQDKSLVLAKGSQNKVFAEEAVKMILADPADASKLVRQSPAWLKKKLQNFQ